ncbi:MAG: RluA family pseudouridine synthase [Patescibacteria group bacterium]|nr:RluA family pseudouridine synthase [Patescibacteria group bacterium]
MPKRQFVVQDLKTRLDKFLVQQVKGVSRSQIQRDIEAGLVTVNGKKVVESKFVVRLGDDILYEEPNFKNQEAKLQPTDTPLKVLYDNHGLLIINKPAGMVVHPGAGFKGETLASALLYHYQDIYVVGEEHRPGIVHRLDKDTSGVMLVAKTQEMYEYLKNAFAERKIKKEYIALVLGHVEKPHGFIDVPIGKSKTDFRKQTTENPQDPKEALTEYRVLEYLNAGGVIASASDLSPEASAKGERDDTKRSGVDEYTLLLVKLHTGRTHQIRVHLASLGHPLMGDSLYGGKKSLLSGLERQFLHARKIEVRLSDGTWIEAESELTDDLKEVLKNLNSKLANTL